MSPPLLSSAHMCPTCTAVVASMCACKGPPNSRACVCSCKGPHMHIAIGIAQLCLCVLACLVTLGAAVADVVARATMTNAAARKCSRHLVFRSHASHTHGCGSLDVCMQGPTHVWRSASLSLAYVCARVPRHTWRCFGRCCGMCNNDQYCRL